MRYTFRVVPTVCEEENDEGPHPHRLQRVEVHAGDALCKTEVTKLSLPHLAGLNRVREFLLMVSDRVATYEQVGPENSPSVWLSRFLGANLVVVHKNVGRFDVAMDKVVEMHEIKGICYLCNDMCGLKIFLVLHPSLPRVQITVNHDLSTEVLQHDVRSQRTPRGDLRKIATAELEAQRRTLFLFEEVPIEGYNMRVLVTARTQHDGTNALARCAQLEAHESKSLVQSRRPYQGIKDLSDMSLRPQGSTLLAKIHGLVSRVQQRTATLAFSER
jgi:hypothetical protein